LIPRGHLLLVVDDGSSDATPAMLHGLARKSAGLIVTRKQNGGHGSAILHGYREALRLGCEWIFQVDSDGQFRASDYDLLWSRRHLSGFILGYRAERMDPLYRRLLSRLYRLLPLLIFGVYLKDPNVPYRLMRASLLETMLDCLPPSVFAPNVFLAILAARGGQPSLDIPVQHLARIQGNSAIGWSQTARVARTCMHDLLRFRMEGFRTFDRNRAGLVFAGKPPGKIPAGRT